MINQLITRYLDVDSEQAKALLDLLVFEKQVSQPVTWKDQTFQLSQAKTQADVITFLQAVGQGSWFKGHDRSKFSDITDDKLNRIYYEFSHRLGLTHSIGLPEGCLPQFSVILGSSESEVAIRVETLRDELRSGHIPEQRKIFGLGCNRQLGVSVTQSEAASKERLLGLERETTEMEMVSLLTTDMVKELHHLHLDYEPINTQANVKSREDDKCVKTGDTATSLKQAIERLAIFPELKRPIIVTVASRQPYAERQRRDVQKALGPDYQAVAMARDYPWERYLENPKAINVIRGELARLINTNYTPENLKAFEQPLSSEELDELARLCQRLESSPYLDRQKFTTAPASPSSQKDTSSHSNEDSSTFELRK